MDICVANAGGPPSRTFAETTPEDWRARRGPQPPQHGLVRARGRCPLMQRRRWGRFIAITSVSVKQPIEGLILSNSVRSAVSGLMKTLANEYGPYNVLVNSVCPGYTATARLEALSGRIAAAEGVNARTGPGALGRAKRRSRRLGKPEEFANAVVFLASERASYVTGAALASRRRPGAGNLLICRLILLLFALARLRVRAQDHRHHRRHRSRRPRRRNRRRHGHRPRRTHRGRRAQRRHARRRARHPRRRPDAAPRPHRPAHASALRRLRPRHGLGQEPQGLPLQRRHHRGRLRHLRRDLRAHAAAHQERRASKGPASCWPRASPRPAATAPRAAAAISSRSKCSRRAKAAPPSAACCPTTRTPSRSSTTAGATTWRRT